MLRNIFAACLLIVGFGLVTHPTYAHTPHDDVFAVEVSPGLADDDTIYTLTRSSVLKSQNGGESWRRMIKGLDNVQMLVDLEMAADGQTLFVGSRGEGLFVSYNGGESWQHLQNEISAETVFKIVSSRSDVAHLIVLNTDGRAFHSDDGGLSFAAMEGPFGAVTAAYLHALPDASDVMYLGDNQGRVFRSRNAADWDEVFTHDAASPITALAVDHDAGGALHPTILIGTQSGGLYASNAGEGFVPVNLPPNAGDAVTSIAIAPRASSRRAVLVTFWDSEMVCGALDNAVWQVCSDGLSNDNQANILGRPDFGEAVFSPDFQRDGAIYVAGFDGLFASYNRGHRYELIETFPKDYIIALAASPNYAQDNLLMMTNMLWGIFSSTSGGDDWTEMNRRELLDYARGNGFTRLFSPVFSPSFASDGILFTSTWYKLYKSVNAGEDWTPINPVEDAWWDEKGHHALSLAISPDFTNDGTVFAGTNWGVVMRSLDGGESFSKLGTKEHNVSSVVISPAYADDKTAFASDVSGVNKSQDGGETWTHSPLIDEDLYALPHLLPVAYTPKEQEGFSNFLDIELGKALSMRLAISPDFAQDGIVFASGPTGIYRSSDAGETWRALAITSVGPRQYVEALSISPDFANDQTVLATVRGYGLFRSTDGGQSFVPAARDLLDRQVIFAHYNGVTPKTPTMVFSPSFKDDRSLFAYDGQKVYRSTDAGAHWTQVTSPQPGFQTRLFTFYVGHAFRYRYLILFAGLAFVAALLAAAFMLGRRFL